MVFERTFVQDELAHPIQHRLPLASLHDSLTNHHRCYLDPHRLLFEEVNSQQWWMAEALSDWDVSMLSVCYCALAFSIHAHHRPPLHRAHYRRHLAALP